MRFYATLVGECSGLNELFEFDSRDAAEAAMMKEDFDPFKNAEDNIILPDEDPDQVRAVRRWYRRDPARSKF